MAIIAALCFAMGAFFLALGAWPVLGFVGLDFLAILVAFRLSYRSARAYEEIEVSRAALVVRKVKPGGARAGAASQPALGAPGGGAERG